MNSKSTSLTVAALLAFSVFAVHGAHAQDWQLVWADEFDGAAVDESRWSFEIADGCPDLCGWGNGEEQYYASENATVEDGLLRITVRKEAMGGREYTSARMRTLEKGDWLYGRIEVRAKLPSGQGFWPAIWMLPTDNVYGTWAASGEIDIMELFGTESSTVHGTIHFGGESPGNTFEGGSYTLSEGTFPEAFHVFAIEWVPGEIRWYVDGNLYHKQTDWYSTADRFPAPFDQSFHLLLNVAIGGGAGSPDGTSVFPQSMDVDYVRVYQSENTLPTATLVAPLDGATLTEGDDLVISVSASDADGAISRASFYAGDGLLGVDDEAPFEWTISSVASGCYAISARVTDNLGGQVSTAPSNVTVDGCVQSPYLATRAILPGRVEAEYYDLGGEGVAYHDVDDHNSGNDTGNDLRVGDGVDIDYEPGQDRGYRVLDFEDGEWLEYQVQIAAEGRYDVELSLKSASGGKVSVLLGEQSLMDALDVGVQNWSTLRVTGLTLPAGPATLRVEVTQGSMDFDHLTVVPNNDPPQVSEWLIEDFSDGVVSRWGTFGGVSRVAASDGAGTEPFMKATFSGSGGTGTAFYGVTWLNLPDDHQAPIPADPWISLRIRHSSAGTTVDQYAFEVTVREDTNGNGWSSGSEDSHRFDFLFSTTAFNDEWVWVSAPLAGFMDLKTGGNGFLDVALDEIVLVASQVTGPNPSSVEIDIDKIRLTSGPLGTGTDGVDDLPSGIELSSVYPNPVSGTAFVEFTVDNPGAITLGLYDVLGRRIDVLLDGARGVGRHQLRLNTASLSAGIYLLRLKQAGAVSTRQLVVMR